MSEPDRFFDPDEQVGPLTQLPDEDAANDNTIQRLVRKTIILGLLGLPLFAMAIAFEWYKKGTAAAKKVATDLWEAWKQDWFS